MLKLTSPYNQLTLFLNSNLDKSSAELMIEAF